MKPFASHIGYVVSATLVALAIALTTAPAFGSEGPPLYRYTVSALFGNNLIVNGDAESGKGSPDGGVLKIPGWTVHGNFTAVQYGASGGFPEAKNPGPLHRGKNFFAGGPNNAESSAIQIIIVSAASKEIDSGTVTFKLAGYLGGFAGQEDRAVVSVDFLDSGGTTLGHAGIGPVTAANRNGETGLLERHTSGKLPAKTRAVRITITATRASGLYNDGYCDNLSFILHAGG